LFVQSGHVVLAQRKTKDSHCYDPIFVFFRNLCKKQLLSESSYRLFDSKSEYEHAFELEKDGHVYFLKWDSSSEGSYSIDEDGSLVTYTPSELIEHFEKIISS
jgi:hypothetical protein